MYLSCRSCTVSVWQCKAFWPITCWMILGSVSRVWLVKLTILLSLHPPSDSFFPVPQFGKEKYKSEEISEVPLLHAPFSVVRKSSSAMNHNHPSVKFTVQKVQSCVGVKNQFHNVQLLKLFLVLFSMLYKLLEYVFAFLRDIVTSHYLVVA